MSTIGNRIREEQGFDVECLLVWQPWGLNCCIKDVLESALGLVHNSHLFASSTLQPIPSSQWLWCPSIFSTSSWHQGESVCPATLHPSRPIEPKSHSGIGRWKTSVVVDLFAPDLSLLQGSQWIVALFRHIDWHWTRWMEFNERKNSTIHSLT